MKKQSTGKAAPKKLTINDLKKLRGGTGMVRARQALLDGELKYGRPADLP